MSVTRPVSDLHERTAEISRMCRESAEPLILKEEGQKDLVLMSLDTYEGIQAKVELYRLLDEAEEDVRNGDRGITVEAMRKRLSL